MYTDDMYQCMRCDVPKSRLYQLYFMYVFVANIGARSQNVVAAMRTLTVC